MLYEVLTGRLPFTGPPAQVLTSKVVDPIFARPTAFYLFTLPAWQLVTGWMLTLGVFVCGVCGAFVVISGGTRVLSRGKGDPGTAAWRGLSIGFGLLLAFTRANPYLTRSPYVVKWSGR